MYFSFNYMQSSWLVLFLSGHIGLISESEGLFS